MRNSPLFSPLRLGALQLKHRIVMAPLTRMRATQPGNVPNEMNSHYYEQRASAGGLLITEATQISRTGQGYPATPGIHSPEQVAGWRRVTDAVRKRRRHLSSALARRSYLASLASGRWPTTSGSISGPARGPGVHGVLEMGTV